MYIYAIPSRFICRLKLSYRFSIIFIVICVYFVFNHLISNYVRLNIPRAHLRSSKRFLFKDNSLRPGIDYCSDGLIAEIVNGKSENYDVRIFQGKVDANLDKSHYNLVYDWQAEDDSTISIENGESWKLADFAMWQNLDLSFPSPATFFHIKTFLQDLISPPLVQFINKNKDFPIAWIQSNCRVPNKREKFIEKLSKLINVKTYGQCFNNKDTEQIHRFKSNPELYAKYKFVIAIENSNCIDYVTEKLSFAIASGSIPIVAGKNGKPDYLKYLPKNSYINIYDYKSVEGLVDHLNSIANDEVQYNSYITFRLNHNYSRAYLNNLSLKDIRHVAQTVIDRNEKFFSELLLKESSESKVCKVAKYLYETPEDTIRRDIRARKIQKPSFSEACLNKGNLFVDFNN